MGFAPPFGGQIYYWSSSQCKQSLFYLALGTRAAQSPRRCTDAPSLASMYKFNDLSQNFRYANPNQENENNTLSQNGLRVYPNPASNQIKFDFSNDAKNAKCAITDMQGRIVKSVTVQSTSPRIDLSNLSAGSYVLNVSFDNNQSFTAKFVVYEK